MIILHFFHIFNKNYDSESGHHFHFQIHLPNSTKLKYNHIVTSNLNILNSTELY